MTAPPLRPSPLPRTVPRGGALLLLVAVLAVPAGCRPAPSARDAARAGAAEGEEPILVFAAASLADVLTEAAKAWERDHPAEPIDLSFAGSRALARQVAAGAPADLLITADRESLVVAGGETGASGGRIDADRAIPLLGNRMVVVVPAPDDAGGAGGRDGRGADALSSARDLLDFRRLGLADPESVPAGAYARAWLEEEGVWEELAPRVVPALDVRANLAAVASGSVDAGIVYATDAHGVAGRDHGLAERVRIVYQVPDAGVGGGAPPVVYWAAAVGDSGVDAMTGRSRGRALRFLAFLTGHEAEEIFRRHGFRHLPRGRSGEAG